MPVAVSACASHFLPLSPPTELNSSFTAAKWFAKPASVDPLQCARFGWSNVAKDMLQCGTCGVELCLRIPDEVSDKVPVFSLFFSPPVHPSNLAVAVWCAGRQ